MKTLLRTARQRPRAALVLLALAAVALLAVLPWYVSSAYWVLVAADVCVFAVLGLSYNMLLGQLGLFSLGHALFFCFGGYVVANLVTDGAGLLTGALVAVVGTTALAFVVGSVTLRVPGIYFAIVTVAIAQAAFTAAGRNAFGLTGGENGLYMTGIPEGLNVNINPDNVYWLAFFVMLGATAVVGLIRWSPMGKIWEGIRENPLRAEALGVNVRAHQRVAFTIAGALAGVAGALNVVALQVAAPDHMALHVMVQALLIVIIGGPGTFLGPIFGAIFVRLAGPLLDQLERASWVQGLPDVIHRAITSQALVLGTIYILLVLFLPGGLASLGSRLRERQASRGRDAPTARQEAVEPA
jgi:branched-chain amino acid transport system permease protein